MTFRKNTITNVDYSTTAMIDLGGYFSRKIKYCTLEAKFTDLFVLGYVTDNGYIGFSAIDLDTASDPPSITSDLYTVTVTSTPYYYPKVFTDGNSDGYVVY